MSDTQPIPVVSAVDPAAPVASVLLIRVVLALVAVVGALVAAVLLYRHGLSEHVYPAYLAGQDGTDVVRYRGPWIGAAAAAVLVAGLLLGQAIKDLRVRSLARPRPSAAGQAGSSTSRGASPTPTTPQS